MSELEKWVEKCWNTEKKRPKNSIFHGQQLKVACISVMILDQLSTFFHMKQRKFRKTQWFLSCKRKKSRNYRKSMFTKMATIFTSIEWHGWKFATTILNGMQTLCERK